MSDPFREQSFPRGAIIATGCLLAFALLSTLAARLTNVGVTEMPPSAVVETRSLRFADLRDGSVAVFNGGQNAPFETLAPGGDGFVRGVLRGLTRERKRRQIAGSEPFELTRWADGRLTVRDPSTDRTVDLGAFGPDNYNAFRHLFDASAAAQPSAADSELASR